MAYGTCDIRNLAFVGHAASGKTSLTEALLAAAGVIGQPGSVEQGNTITDFTEEEHDHGHSLVSGIVHADYQGKHINLIDTPGSPDFIGQAIAVLPAVDTVAVAVSAPPGTGPLTRRIMQPHA